MQRIGIFGGTFNPVHTGHLRIATEIKEHFSLDSIIFIPTGLPPHKESEKVIESVHRLQMVKFATAPFKHFTVSPIEVERSDMSYSVDTIKVLRKQMADKAELYFIVGIDAFLDFNTWKDTDELLTLCHFIVIPRPGHKFAELKKLEMPLLHNIALIDLEQLDRGEINRISIPLTERYFLFLEWMTPCDISSTELRRLIKEGREVKNLLPESVLLYIMENSLYH